MAVFSYKAIDHKGKNVKGVIDAESIRDARTKLKSKKIFPTELNEADNSSNKLSFSFGQKATKISTTQLSIITRQFATLVAAGMPLVESLKALSEQIDNAAIKKIIVEIRDNVNEGANLADSLKKYPTAFPKLYVNMVASGEASGSLDLVLERLADLLESQAELQKKVISALTYPFLMLLLCFGVIILLLGYVVPQITKIFEDQGAVLPLPTRIVITLSNLVQSYWYLIIILIIAAVYFYKSYSSTAKGRETLDRLIFKIPIIGNLKLKIACSRFAKNLGTMLFSGIRLLGGLEIVKNILGNVVLEQAVEDAVVGVREGGSLANEISKSGHFPKLLIHMIAIGEKTGQLEQMLNRAAKSYETEVDSAISSFTSILEPLLIIFLAFIVGAILAAVMLPMLEMTSLAK